ncbi:hypothetical protein [Methanococcoides methylutens]|uniref:Uncharacterized protein n=1 Tax=Methanococcoides methylutens MM1 TaxID=1434104 RepID=A0A0E3SRZ9_METMT|nr:hypothetical protein [Methanococcoides methylutens]AKB85851.1 hypothetical protein MCMEM_1798 [Methanococcoides methylutens MM1]
MGCIFCGKICAEAGVEGEYGEEVAEGRIVGHTHICMDCLAELKEILDIEEIEKKLAETEYEIFEEVSH